MKWLVAASVAAGCGRAPQSEEHELLDEVDETTPVAPFVPRIEGGEIVRGAGGVVTVSLAPANARVELLRGARQGQGSCASAPCVGTIADPEPVAELVADAAGTAVFPVDDEGEPREIVWQARVTDPVDPRLVAYTDAVVRHVALHPLDARVLLTRVTRQAGLESTFTLGNTHTGGVAFVDVNGDYLPDIFLLSGAGTPNRLYLNAGGGQFFEDSDRIRKPHSALESAGVTFADLENDGDLDVMVPVDNPAQMISSVAQSYDGGPNLLYVNDGTGWFEERAAPAGVVDPRGWRNSNASFADFDADGCVDLYLLQWAMAAPPGGDNHDRLLRGRCDGTFDDVTDTFGIDPNGRDGLGLLWWDADHDRFPELYVANNADRDELPVFDPEDDYWKNLGGTSLESWTRRSDPSVGMDGWAGMGMDIGDIDGDGDWDLYITDVWELPPLPKGNVLYLGDPDGTLSANACQEKGVCFGYNSWPTNFADFDNDGWVDLWVGASVATDPSLLYLNKGDGSGEFVPVRVDGWTGYVGRGGTAADYDADGDIDVFLWVEGGDSSLWQNELDGGAHWLELRLLGTQSNRAAIGARIEVEASGARQLRRVSGGDSAHSQTDLAVHFGLGEAAGADRVHVYWPSGRVQHFSDVAADRFWLVDEDLGLVHEELVEPTAIWDPTSTMLTVTVGSTYRGRTTIVADDLGPLGYLLPDQVFAASFTPESRPDVVTLRTATGLVQEIAVTDAP